jgi:hypothetical protein
MGDDSAWAMGWTNNPHRKKMWCIDCFGRTSEMGETCSTHRSVKNCVNIFCWKIQVEESVGCLG